MSGKLRQIQYVTCDRKKEILAATVFSVDLLFVFLSKTADRAPASGAADSGLIPSRVKSEIIILVLIASLLDVQH